MAKRSTGVTVAGILGFIHGILMVLAGLGMVIGGAFLAAMVSSLGVGIGTLGGLVGVVIVATGVVLLIVGILLLLGFYWVWGLKRKGFLLALVLEIIMLLGGLYQLATSLMAMSFTAASAGFILPLILVILLWVNKKSFK